MSAGDGRLGHGMSGVPTLLLSTTGAGRGRFGRTARLRALRGQLSRRGFQRRGRSAPACFTTCGPNQVGIQVRRDRLKSALPCDRTVRTVSNEPYGGSSTTTTTTATTAYQQKTARLSRHRISRVSKDSTPHHCMENSVPLGREVLAALTSGNAARSWFWPP